jgi:hypothetical protein
MKRLREIFRLTSSEQRVVVIVVLVLLAAAVLQKHHEQTVRILPIQSPASAKKPIAADAH